MLNKTKLVAILSLELFLLSSAPTFGEDIGQANNSNSQSKTEQTGKVDGLWKPFLLRPGDYFKYTMTDHVIKKQGWIEVHIVEKSEEKLEVRWNGVLGGKKFLVTTSGPSNRLIEFSRPDLSSTPGTISFLATVLSSLWEKLEGVQWQVGAKWDIVLDEMAPAAFFVKIDGPCTIAGQEGFSSRFIGDETVLMEACVSPGLPIALWAKTYEGADKPRYEARLVEYRHRKRMGENEK